MAGFFKKVAGAFVYLDEGPEKPKISSPSGSPDEVLRETDELIAQLGGPRSNTPSTSSAAKATKTAETAGPASDQSFMTMTAEEVFAASDIPDGPNSAQRVLKIIAGLNMFPKEQQTIMVRAMDAADET